MIFLSILYAHAQNSNLLKLRFSICIPDESGSNSKGFNFKLVLLDIDIDLSCMHAYAQLVIACMRYIYIY